MTQTITRWLDDAVLWTGEAADLCDAVIQAVAARATLSGATLSGATLSWATLSRATLSGADLSGAKELRLPTGELLSEYFTDTLPALLTAGGKSLESFREHWECHSWDNCPMHHAFDAMSEEACPVLLRPHVRQFVELYDARQIPWSVVQATIDKHAAGSSEGGA